MTQSQSANLFVLLGLSSILASIAVLGIWQMQGGNEVTQYQVAQTVTETDEFGIEVEQTVLEDEFQFGLLPDRGYDGAAPLSSFFGVLGLILLAVGLQRRRNLGSNDPNQPIRRGEE